MNFKRMFAMMDIIIRGHILVPMWWSREKRREKRYKVLLSVIPRYFKNSVITCNFHI